MARHSSDVWPKIDSNHTNASSSNEIARILHPAKGPLSYVLPLFSSRTFATRQACEDQTMELGMLRVLTTRGDGVPKYETSTRSDTAHSHLHSLATPNVSIKVEGGITPDER